MTIAAQLVRAGRKGADAPMRIVQDVAPNSAKTLQPIVTQLSSSHSSGPTLILGLAVALWSA